jgi:hypothetical protein
MGEESSLGSGIPGFTGSTAKEYPKPISSAQASCSFSLRWILDGESVVFRNDEASGVMLFPGVNGERKEI